MLDRQDIDALLMGALYGELSPDESTRLEEHLSAHPQDRMVLDGLGRARQALRDSHVLAVQAEPPAAVTALLMQEAARRAPAPREQRVGFFAKLVVFLRHPATAAAAVIVLVAGVASTLYLKNGDRAQFAEETVATPSTPPAATAPGPTHAGDEMAAGSGSAIALSLDGHAPARQGDLTTEERGYNADLETEKLDSKRTGDDGARTGKGNVAGTGSTTSTQKPAPPADRVATDDYRADKDKLGKAAGTKQRYVEVTTPDPEPKTLDNGIADTTSGRDTAGAGAGSRGAQTVIVPIDPATTAGLDQDTVVTGGVPVAPNANLARPPGQSGGTAGGKTGSVKKTEPSKAPAMVRDDTAAKSAHARAVALVKANKCKDAAKVAVSIYQSFPEYYADSVANDRQLKVCKPYIENERKKANEAMKSRAKMANEADQPAESTK